MILTFCDGRFLVVEERTRINNILEAVAIIVGVTDVGRTVSIQIIASNSHLCRTDCLVAIVVGGGQCDGVGTDVVASEDGLTQRNAGYATSIGGIIISSTDTTALFPASSVIVLSLQRALGTTLSEIVTAAWQESVFIFTSMAVNVTLLSPMLAQLKLV